MHVHMHRYEHKYMYKLSSTCACAASDPSATDDPLAACGRVAPLRAGSLLGCSSRAQRKKLYQFESKVTHVVPQTFAVNMAEDRAARLQQILARHNARKEQQAKASADALQSASQSSTDSARASASSPALAPALAPVLVPAPAPLVAPAVGSLSAANAAGPQVLRDMQTNADMVIGVGDTLVKRFDEAAAYVLRRLYIKFTNTDSSDVAAKKAAYDHFMRKSYKAFYAAIPSARNLRESAIYKANTHTAADAIRLAKQAVQEGHLAQDASMKGGVESDEEDEEEEKEEDEDASSRGPPHVWYEPSVRRVLMNLLLQDRRATVPDCIARLTSARFTQLPFPCLPTDQELVQRCKAAKLRRLVTALHPVLAPAL
jgi:hypothetical protein